jgi:glycosyltransferase involved in cell wall biosynthesis
MKKKVLFQLNQLGYGGTEKAIYTFIQNMDKEKYLPQVFFYTDFGSFNFYRRKFLSLFSHRYKNNFNQKYNINFSRLNDFIALIGQENVFLGTENIFYPVAAKVDIIHFNRGASEDFYTKNINNIPDSIKICETNIYAKESNQIYMNRLSSIFFVSKWLMNKEAWPAKYNSKVLYNPICLPKTKENFRMELNIPDSAIVLGKINRPNLAYEDFILNVLNNVLSEDIYFLFIGATEKFVSNTKSIHNIICLNPTTDETLLSKFYNTLDILLHQRKEGETFGMNIAEAMIHSKPVVSHYSSIGNAPAELLLEENISGIVVEENDLNAYVNAILTLVNDNDLRYNLGRNAKIKAEKYYSEVVVTTLLESYYDEILKS